VLVSLLHLISIAATSLTRLIRTHQLFYSEETEIMAALNQMLKEVHEELGISENF